MNPIHGVKTKQLKVIPDERGRLAEALRADEEIFIKFGQVYYTTVSPGVTKAWHYHKKQVDNFVCVKGMIKLALYDDRDGSPTKEKINEFFVGDHNPMLVQIPALVWHGFKCVSESEAIIINISTEPYHHAQPDEYRKDPHKGGIPYDWARRDG